MLKNATGFRHIYLRCGYTDLRRGIDGLAMTIKGELGLDPYAQDSIYLFCGRRADRIKALVYEGDGFTLLYKRLADGRFQWPRNESEVRDLTQEQFQALMDGFAPIQKKTIKNVSPTCV